MPVDENGNGKKRCRRLSVSLFLLLLLALQSALATPLAAMDLMEAYIRARQHDPLFGSYVHEHEASRTLPAQGRSFLLPQIQAYGSESRYYYDNAPSYYRDFDSESLGVSLKQPIFNVSRFYEYRQHKVRKKDRKSVV